MNNIDAISTITDSIIESSRLYNGDDSTNYAYAFGMLSGAMKTLLDDLALDSKQIKVLNNYVERFNKP